MRCRHSVGLTLAGLLLLAGCGGGERSAARPDTIVAGPAGATARSDCPLTGAWRPCSVQDRLERAGLAPKLENDTTHRAGFSVPGTRVTLGRATLELFLYPSEAARARDTGALDSARAAPRDRAGNWPALPTLITSGNLAAVLYDAKEAQAERVALALGAGLPQR